MATYSRLEELDLDAFQDAYGLRIEDWTPIAGGMANSSFRVAASGEEFVVSILDNQDDQAAERLAAANIAMGKSGIPTSTVVPRRNGDHIFYNSGKRVLVRQWLPGVTHKKLPQHLLRAAGELLGKIHDVPQEGLDVPLGNRRLSAALVDVLEDFPDQQHAEWIRRRLVKLQALFPSNDSHRWTAVHGDFIGANIVEDAGQLFAIDWETLTIDEPMLDVGMSLLNMCVEGTSFDDARASLFLEGYRRSGRSIAETLIRPGVEYAAVILAFHRYRRHHIRFPNPARHDYYRIMVDFVEHEFSASSPL